MPDLKVLRRSSLSPHFETLSKNPEEKRFESPERIYFGKESSVKLPYINKKLQSDPCKASPSGRTSKAKSTMCKYYDVSRIQRENNALRDFIHNFHLKKDGPRVVSSLDALTNGTTHTIAGKVQRYFSQLEDYIKKL
jgi:hypothetical protein